MNTILSLLAGLAVLFGPSLIEPRAPDGPEAPGMMNISLAKKDSIVLDTIGPEGGIVRLDGVAAISFPPGAFSVRTPVVLSQITQDQDVRQIFHAVTADTLPVPPLPYEVRVYSGHQPFSGAARVEIEVPKWWLEKLPDSWEPWIYTLGDGLGQFNPVPSYWDPEGGTVSFNLYHSFFEGQDRERELNYAASVVGAVPPETGGQN